MKGPAMIAAACLALLAAARGGPAGSRVAQLGSTTTQSSAATQNGALAWTRWGCNARAVRTAAAIIAGVGLALLAAACGGSRGNHVAQLGTTATQSSSSSIPSAAPTRTDGALAFSHCMRSHGVLQFPDPDSSGAIPKVGLQQLGISTAQFQAAQSACAYLLRPTTVQVQQTLRGMVAFAHCMRSHGVRAWPDPTTDSDGQAVFDLHGRVNPDTPQMDIESGECAHLLQPAPGQNGTVLCNGIGEAGCHHYG